MIIPSALASFLLSAENEKQPVVSKDFLSPYVLFYTVYCLKAVVAAFLVPVLLL